MMHLTPKDGRGQRVGRAETGGGRLLLSTFFLIFVSTSTKAKKGVWFFFSRVTGGLGVFLEVSGFFKGKNNISFGCEGCHNRQALPHKEAVGAKSLEGAL